MAVSTAPRPANTSVISWEKAQQQLKSTNKKTSPLLLIGIVAIAVFALGSFWRLLHQHPSEQYLEVMAARRDIPAGARLGITTISFLKVPKKYATEDMLRSLNDVSGRVVRNYIPAGEPIQSFMLLTRHEGLSSSLETHERALTLQLDDDALVDHSIQADDRVDVLVVSACKNKKYTKTICQDLRVLMAVPKEQSLAHNLNTATNKITLATTPDQAEIITEAIESGKIRLTLRSRVSRMEQHLAGANPDDLLPADAMDKTTAQAPALPLVPAPPPPTPEEPKAENPLQWMVEVISGNHKETYGVPAQ